MKRIYLFMLMVVMTMMSCVPEVEKATVETKDVTDVTSSSARVVCNVSDDGGSEVSSRGVCWDTIYNPVIETASSMAAGSGVGNYECEIDGLNSNTTYYVRAYAINSAGVSYGKEIIFNTLDEDGGDDNDNSDSHGEIAGHEYVDLGLPSGLKWATCNVGAENPEDYGDYFAWGEINPKAEYTEENSLIDIGQPLYDISGDSQYDAATANWGETWRMPTGEEMMELVNNCEWVLNLNGGITVTGPNGYSINLPRAGKMTFDWLGNSELYAYYWTSSPIEYLAVNEYGRVYCSYDPNTNYNGIVIYTDYHYWGYTVRPVSE